MRTMIGKYKSAVAALLIAALAGPVLAQDAGEDLLAQLRTAEDAQAAERLERQLRREWAKSGSPTMDFLLKRGQDALETGDLEAAIAHLGALTDHAPEFAEGWHALALAYFRAERIGLAADALERTLALNPQHFGALRGLGAILEQVDRPKLAYDAFSRVLTLRPHDPGATAALERLERQVSGTSL
ncbi:tetratricopeptide repeat protein [Marivita sp. GX14005]|uniref:tetratricopeptide repeat protein n=1 Tax=Marivita sp. GX14005 TaxID=2942276 RepID=UPI0020188A93|nr:tetratricopeptide repeat protein [Marivita sp. GX14005]MCL3883519.1 tetratricopeptide repeat protein [Marivita sp. GX14005]